MTPNPESSDRFAIRFFACLCILGGVDSLVGMVYDLFHDSFLLDFGFLGIFVGRGLLQRKETWRKWALVLVWAGIISVPVAVALAYFFPAAMEIHLWDLETGVFVPPWLVYSLLAGGFALCVWMRKVLSRPEVKATFSPTGGGHDTWWSAVAAVALLVSLGRYSERDLFHAVLESIAHHQTTIHVIDGATGLPLRPSIGYPGHPSRQILPKVTTRFDTAEDGTVSATVSCLAVTPVTVCVSSAGYHRKEITLTPKEDGKDLIVALQKDPSSTEAGDGGGG